MEYIILFEVDLNNTLFLSEHQKRRNKGEQMCMQIECHLKDSSKSVNMVLGREDEL